MTNLTSPPRFSQRLQGRWERKAVAPAYGAGVLLVIALAFFGAAVNTMAGWLYVISATILALLVMGAIFPPRTLRGIQCQRPAIAPVAAGEPLTVEVQIHNATSSAKTMVSCCDRVPSALGNPPQIPLELLIPGQTYTWIYEVVVPTRGVYHWDRVELRTAAPLGLFWCRRARTVAAKAIIYPQVLPLKRCPLLDQVGNEEHLQFASDRQYHNATEGITKTLRPYRYGDPLRLIHWRSSARLGLLQVRELEVVTGGEDLIIALDTAQPWPRNRFEQAVIAAASLYFYGCRTQGNVKLWTAKTGLIGGNRVVLEALAATQPEETGDAQNTLTSDRLHRRPIVWLTGEVSTLKSLHSGSRWVLFQDSPSGTLGTSGDTAGLRVTAEDNLGEILQRSPF